MNLQVENAMVYRTQDGFSYAIYLNDGTLIHRPLRAMKPGKMTIWGLSKQIREDIGDLYRQIPLSGWHEAPNGLGWVLKTPQEQATTPVPDLRVKSPRSSSHARNPLPQHYRRQGDKTSSEVKSPAEPQTTLTPQELIQQLSR